MNALAEILANARATSKLKPKFYRATSVVGILAGINGLVIMYALGMGLGTALGLDPNEPVRGSSTGILWVVLFFAAIPISFLLAMVPVAWLCGLCLVRIGYMKREDVRHYALRSRYPAHWFKDEDSASPRFGRDAA